MASTKMINELPAKTQSTSGLLVVGKSYVIDETLGSDDFSNVGWVADGTPFIATGTTPTVWADDTIVINITNSLIVGGDYLVADVYVSPGVYVTRKFKKSFLKPYKEYIVVIDQSGTSAPTVSHEINNELINPVTFYYDAVGLFRASCLDFGENDPTPTTIVSASIQSSGNQNDASKAVDCYTTTAPIGRGGTACEIAIESVNGVTLTNGLIFKCELRILVKY